MFRQLYRKESHSAASSVYEHFLFLPSVRYSGYSCCHIFIDRGVPCSRQDPQFQREHANYKKELALIVQFVLGGEGGANLVKPT